MNRQMNEQLNKKGFFTLDLLGKFIPDGKDSKKDGKKENGEDNYKVINEPSGWFMTTVSGHIIAENKFKRLHPTKNDDVFNFYIGSMYGNADEVMTAKTFKPGSFEQRMLDLGLERNPEQFDDAEKKAKELAAKKGITLTEKELMALRDEVKVFTTVNKATYDKLISMKRTDTLVIVGRYNFSDDKYATGARSGNEFRNQITLSVDYPQLFVGDNGRLTKLPYGKEAEMSQYIKLSGKAEDTPTLKIAALDGSYIKRHAKIIEGTSDKGEDYKFATLSMGTLDHTKVTDKMLGKDAKLARENKKNVVTSCTLDKYFFDGLHKLEDNKMYLIVAREGNNVDIQDNVIFSNYKAYNFAGRFNKGMNYKAPKSENTTEYYINMKEFKDGKMEDLKLVSSEAKDYALYITTDKVDEFVTILSGSRYKNFEVNVRTMDKKTIKKVKTDFFALSQLVRKNRLEVIAMKK